MIPVRRFLLPSLMCAGVFCSSCLDQRKSAVKALADEVAVRKASRLRSMRLYEQGMTAYDSSNLEEAAKCMNGAVAEDSRNAQAWMALGVVEFTRGKAFEAASALRRASRLEPARYEPHFNLGALFESLNRYDEAVLEYETAHRLAPDRIEVMENLARCFIRMDVKHDNAKELLDRAMKSECRPEWIRWISQQTRLLERKARVERDK